MDILNCTGLVATQLEEVPQVWGYLQGREEWARISAQSCHPNSQTSTYRSTQLPKQGRAQTWSTCWAGRQKRGLSSSSGMCERLVSGHPSLAVLTNPKFILCQGFHFPDRLCWAKHSPLPGFLYMRSRVSKGLAQADHQTNQWQILEKESGCLACRPALRFLP